jgi:hypothetical protein
MYNKLRKIFLLEDVLFFARTTRKKDIFQVYLFFPLYLHMCSPILSISLCLTFSLLLPFSFYLLPHSSPSHVSPFFLSPPAIPFNVSPPLPPNLIPREVITFFPGKELFSANGLGGGGGRSITFYSQLVKISTW